MDELPKHAPPPAESIRAETTTSAPIKYLQFKVALLLALTLVLAVVFVGYVLYARGVFESTRSVVLVTDDSGGVGVGMPLTFAGFAIGRVRRIELAEDAKVRISIDVPTRDAHWLRVSSVFVIERGLVGGVNIRAVTGQLEDPPLADGAICTAPPRREAGCTVLRGDATEEIPRLMSGIRTVLENLQALSGPDSSLNASLGNVRAVTERMAGKSGALAAALGSEENAAKVVAAVDRANRLLDSLAGVSSRLDQALIKADQALVKADQALVKTDQRLFGRDGIMDETQKVVMQLNAVLGDARESLKKADAVLADVQKVSTSARGATDDLAGLRAEVDASLRKVAALIDEINRKWPFKRDSELKLP